MNLENVIGQTLDDKYKIEKELGRGGMGTVYLATHIGTERPVALKIIAAEFIERAEFVERFRREARAAGRLRHPNVVNVTDFGFAETGGGAAVAYLVMEYLDGCTLGEILKEEKKLPLSWTIDILEQVCSAVHEAHEQGIIHRDLKPDNIWLEPNQRGGYTVKVLDFGIAKLEDSKDIAAAVVGIDGGGKELPENATNRQPNSGGGGGGGGTARETRGGGGGGSAAARTAADHKHQTVSSETATLAFDPAGKNAAEAVEADAEKEAGTLILESGESNSENGGETRIMPDDAPGAKSLSKGADDVDGEAEYAATKLIGAANSFGTAAASPRVSTAKSLLDAPSTGELTRVGAVLGTPLYMSPEQCRGEKLGAHSDIYSLAVIAYQMLSGKTPFDGDYAAVMEAHKTSAPPEMPVKKVSKKIKNVIDKSLAKDPAERPPSAQAFAAELRAQSEGIGILLQRALEIYSKHLPKFLGLTILLYLPFIFATLLKIAYDVFTVAVRVDAPFSSGIVNGLLMILTTFLGIFCGYLVFGTTTWLVTQILAVPLRPVKLRPALRHTQKKWKKLLGTGLLTTILTFIGYAFCLLPGFVLSVRWALVAPVVMMENLRGKAALARSKTLVKRSLRTTIAAVFLMFVVPFAVASITSFFVATTVKSFSGEPADKNNDAREAEKNAAAPGDASGAPAADERVTKISIGGKAVLVSSKDDKDQMSRRIKGVVREDLTSILMLPFQIIIASLSSIIAALLYLKTRQIGGESTAELFEQFEEEKQPARQWQKRMRQRIALPGRTTTTTTGKRATGEQQT